MAAIYPTPENPLVLKYRGHVPSLKNRRRPVKTKQGKLIFKKNEEVQTFLRRVQAVIQDTWSKTTLETLPPPARIGVFVEVVFYQASNKLPASDGDNAYTTIQETLKDLVVADDNQVGYGAFEVLYTQNKSMEHAVAYVWLFEEGVRGAEQHTRLWNGIQQRARQQSAETEMGLPQLIRDLMVQHAVPDGSGTA